MSKIKNFKEYNIIELANVFNSGVEKIFIENNYENLEALKVDLELQNYQILEIYLRVVYVVSKYDRVEFDRYKEFVNYDENIEN